MGIASNYVTGITEVKYGELQTKSSWHRYCQMIDGVYGRCWLWTKNYDDFCYLILNDEDFRNEWLIKNI